MINRTYFPILDPLRFIASLCVFFAHSAVYFRVPGSGISFGPLFQHAGYYGVIFFYTLSGFLISYLLINERRSTGSIAVKSFYMRRILRIGPLYYLIVLVSILVLPRLEPTALTGLNPGWQKVVPFYLLLLPNIVPFLGFALPGCPQVYTIGYEEQFYLVWPWVLRKLDTRRLLYLLTFLFFFLPVLEAVHLLIISPQSPFGGKPPVVIRAALSFINYFNLPAFIAGAAGAILYSENGSQLAPVIGRKIWSFLLPVCIILLMNFTFPSGIGYVNVVSILFIFLILNLIFRGAGNGPVGRLLASGGRISYGIYIYHLALMIIVSYWLNRLHLQSGQWPVFSYILFVLVSFALVIAISALSHASFEKYFLRKKARWQPRA